MKNQEPIRPTGNLEDLFRHHLLDAAVPPRPHVWEQVDNALLLAQNQAYRRRLRLTRWVAAASLLLATLAGAGWWARRDFLPRDVGTIDVGPATDNRPGLAATGVGAAGASNVTISTVAPQAANAPASRAAEAAPDLASASGPATGSSADRTGAHRPAGLPLPDEAATASSSGNVVTRQSTGPAGWASRPAAGATPGNEVAWSPRSRHQQLAEPATEVVAADEPAAGRPIRRRMPGVPGVPAPSGGDELAFRENAGGTGRSKAGTSRRREASNSGLNLPTADASSVRASAASAGAASAGAASAGAAASSETNWAGAESAALLALNGRFVALAQWPVAPVPTPLATQPLPPTEAPAAVARRWRLGLSYAAGTFQPNLNFSRAGREDSYNAALGANSPALTEAAAAEYHAQQRPGLSQRLRLLASRRLRGHWSLVTGLEVAQQDARSATSFIFTGEQVPDLSQSLRGGPRQATSARFRSAGVPVELRYANSIKTGFSLYGRVGTMVSALLTARTEVDDYPEATRTYTLVSGSTPYRRVLGTVRGAAGVQFRPAGHDFTLSLGPVAEGGLWSLNRDAAQGFFSQNRPYSFGLEAGVEFGRTAKAQ